MSPTRLLSWHCPEVLPEHWRPGRTSAYSLVRRGEAGTRCPSRREAKGADKVEAAPLPTTAPSSQTSWHETPGLPVPAVQAAVFASMAAAMSLTVTAV